MNRFRRFTVEPALRFSLVLLSYLCQTINVLVLSGDVSVQLGKVKTENRISQIFIPNLTSFQSSGTSLGRRPGFVPESECKVTASFPFLQIFLKENVFYSIVLTFVYNCAAKTARKLAVLGTGARDYRGYRAYRPNRATMRRDVAPRFLSKHFFTRRARILYLYMPMKCF